MTDEQPIHYAQYLELIKRMTSISVRLNDIESIIGGTKRKWRDEVDIKIKKLEERLTILDGNLAKSPCGSYDQSLLKDNSGYAQSMVKDKPSPTESLAAKIQKIVEDTTLTPYGIGIDAAREAEAYYQDRIEKAHKEGYQSANKEEAEVYCKGMNAVRAELREKFISAVDYLAGMSVTANTFNSQMNYIRDELFGEGKE